MLTRSEGWWRVRRTCDPDWIRGGKGPLQRALLEIDGRPAAYALYRFSSPVASMMPDIPLEISEAIGDSPEATAALFRWLLDIDIASRFTMVQMAVDHPLFFLLSEPRRLRMQISDALWVRLVDVGAALSRRGYAGPGSLVIEVMDEFCPWNTGRFRIADGRAERTTDEPDLALDVEALGALYLGGFSATQLALAGRVAERRPGALRRADVLLRGERAPWCPETF
jgi:predicted acetyltransferase